MKKTMHMTVMMIDRHEHEFFSKKIIFKKKRRRGRSKGKENTAKRKEKIAQMRQEPKEGEELMKKKET